TFNANDGKRKVWMENGKQPLRPKTKGKGIMISAFLTPGGILKPVREAIEYLEYGKNNYWTGDKMVQQAIESALPIFRYAFPRCQGLWAFDNATNHNSFHPKALVASRMQLAPGGKQPEMKEGFDYNRGLPQAMVYPDNYKDVFLRGKTKGLKVVLKERGLWPESGRNPFGNKFLLECPTTYSRSGCLPKEEGRCCAKSVMAAQRDFQEQKGWLQEEFEAAHQEVIFYPKFHCELNFIEQFWCAAKWYTRENCEYTIEGLRRILPEALHSVPLQSINR
ncbi:hypothetical protein FN846DRAFT_758996, partial [Sphaerosporella brunnea]